MHSPEPRNLLTLALLLAGAVISTILVVDTWDEEEKREKPQLSLAYYLDSAELTGTAADGTILYRVRTRRAAQSVGDDSIELEEVEMEYGPPEGMPWALAAKTGRIPEDASIIELSGNVVATSGDDKDNATTIRTNRLDIDPETRLATTDQKVTIDYNGRELHATGMRANFEKNQLNLLSNVNGKFVP